MLRNYKPKSIGIMNFFFKNYRLLYNVMFMQNNILEAKFD